MAQRFLILRKIHEAPDASSACDAQISLA